MVLNARAFDPPPSPPKTVLVPGVAWDPTIKPEPRKKQVRLKPEKQLNIDPLAEAKEQLAEMKRKKHGK
jgi:hypothetical protein